MSISQAPLEAAQVEGINKIILNSYSICAMDMGLGKTRVALEATAKLGGTTLVVCPSYLIMNWFYEIKKWHGETRSITIIRKKTDIYPLWDTNICLISYENAKYAEILFEWADTVVFDEGQYLKNMKAQRTENCHRLVYENSNKNMVILTGTPIKNRVSEFYSLIALCNYNPKLKKSLFLEKYPDQIVFSDHFSNRMEYTMEVNGRFVKVLRWEGLKNKTELKMWLKDIYYRAEAKEGNIVHKDVYVHPEDFPDLRGELEALELGFESVQVKAKVLAAMAMADYTISHAKDVLDQVGQVVIYSDHVDSCEKIAKALNVPAITGQMKPENRLELGNKFQRGELSAICATYKSFSTGVTLTRANNMILNDPPWSPGDLAQALKRIDRIGQTKRCVAHRMIGSHQHQKIYQVLTDKMEIIKEIT